MKKYEDTKWDKDEFTKSKTPSDSDKKDMHEYYQAGRKTGKSSPDLLQELHERYKRSTRQIQRYFARIAQEALLPTDRYGKDYSTRAKPPAKAAPSPVPPDLYVSRQYQKHQNDMIHLIKRLSTELDPPLSHFHIRNLGKVGPHRLSNGEIDTGLEWSLVWQVNGDRSVCLCYELEADEDAQTRIMRGYLEEHLHSSTYSWLIEDEEKGIRKWKRLGGEELRAQTCLLNRIDREVNELTNSALGDPNRMTCAGPSTWFSESIWAAVLAGLHSTLVYKIETYDNGLFKAQYGDTLMGLTATKEEGEQYIEWHKKLMAKYERSRTGKAINLLRQERDSVAKGIQDVLTKFVVDRHLPGKCNYKFCR